MHGKLTVITICIMLVAVFTAGCLTTSQKGAVIGTGTGAALGAGIGALTGNPGMGAAIGAGAGAIGGALVGDHIDEERREAERYEWHRQLEMERLSSSGQGKNHIEGHYEFVMKKKWVDTSRKERVWVNEHYEGNRRIEGHYEERLVPSGNWQKYEEKTWVPAHYE